MRYNQIQLIYIAKVLLSENVTVKNNLVIFKNIKPLEIYDFENHLVIGNETFGWLYLPHQQVRNILVGDTSENDTILLVQEFKGE